MGSYGETIDISSPFFARLADDDRILAQAVYMRLTTRRGTYFTAPDYGLAVTDYVLEGLTNDALERIPYEVKAQLELDERIAGATVTATKTPTEIRGGYALILDITIMKRKGTPLALTLGVSEVTVEVLTRGAG